MNLFDYIFRYETAKDRENANQSHTPMVQNMHAWEKPPKKAPSIKDKASKTPKADKTNSSAKSSSARLIAVATAMHNKTPYKKIARALWNNVVTPLYYIITTPTIYMARGFFNLSDRSKAFVTTLAIGAGTLAYGLHSNQEKIFENETPAPQNTQQNTRFEKVPVVDASRAEKIIVANKSENENQDAAIVQSSHNLVAQFAAYQNRGNALAAVKTLQDHHISTRIIHKQANNTGQIHTLFAVVSSTNQSCADVPALPENFGCFNLTRN